MASEARVGGLLAAIIDATVSRGWLVGVVAAAAAVLLVPSQLLAQETPAYLSWAAPPALTC